MKISICKNFMIAKIGDVRKLMLENKKKRKTQQNAEVVNFVRL